MLELSPQQTNLLKRCLDAACDSDVFSEREFNTLFGLDRDQFLKMVAAWPALDVTDFEIWRAIACALNQLMGYPHKSWERLSFNHSEVEDLDSAWQAFQPPSPAPFLPQPSHFRLRGFALACLMEEAAKQSPFVPWPIVCLREKSGALEKALFTERQSKEASRWYYGSDRLLFRDGRFHPAQDDWVMARVSQNSREQADGRFVTSIWGAGETSARSAFWWVDVADLRMIGLFSQSISHGDNYRKLWPEKDRAFYEEFVAGYQGNERAAQSWPLFFSAQ